MLNKLIGPKSIVGVIVGIVAIMMLSSSMVTVGTGTRGVVTKFGKPTGEALDEGLHLVNPVTTKVIKMDVRTQKWNNESMAFTKDVQEAKVAFTLNYNLDPTATVRIYQTVGKNWEAQLLPQIVLGAIKNTTGKWEAVDMIEHRNEVAVASLRQIKEKLDPLGIHATNLEFNDVDYSDKFTNAVEAKVVAIQQAIEEKNRTVKVAEKARQTVLTAKADAESMRIRANALTSNPKLVEYEAVQKWDGKLPQYTLGGAMPFINLNHSK